MTLPEDPDPDRGKTTRRAEAKTTQSRFFFVVVWKTADPNVATDSIWNWVWTVEPSLHCNGRSWILLKHQSQQNSLSKTRRAESLPGKRSWNSTARWTSLSYWKKCSKSWAWHGGEENPTLCGGSWLKQPVLTGRQEESSPGMEQYLDISTSWRPKAVPGLRLTAPAKVRDFFVPLFPGSETQASARPEECPPPSRQKGQPWGGQFSNRASFADQGHDEMDVKEFPLSSGPAQFKGNPSGPL